MAVNDSYKWVKDIIIPTGQWVYIPEVGVDVIQDSGHSQIVTAFQSSVDDEFRVMHTGYALGMRLHKDGS